MSSWRFLPQGYAERVAGTASSESARMLANALMNLGGNLATGFNRGTQAIRSDMDRAQELQSMLYKAGSLAEIQERQKQIADRFGYLGAPYTGQPAPVPRRQPLPTPRAVPQPPPAQVPEARQTEAEAALARMKKRVGPPTYDPPAPRPEDPRLMAPSTTPDHSGTFGDPAPAPDPEQPVKKIQDKWARGLPNTDITYKQFFDIYEAKSAKESVDPEKWTKFHKGSPGKSKKDREKQVSNWLRRYNKYKGLHEKHLAKTQTAPGQPAAKPIAKADKPPMTSKQAMQEQERQVGDFVKRNLGGMLPETIDGLFEQPGQFRSFGKDEVKNNPAMLAFAERQVRENKKVNQDKRDFALKRITPMVELVPRHAQAAMERAAKGLPPLPEHYRAKTPAPSPWARQSL